MADVPKDLLQEIKRLEEMFIVSKDKLKEITTHFVSELEKGNNGLSDSALHQCHSSRDNALASCTFSSFCFYMDLSILLITLIKSDIKPGLSVEGGTIVSTLELCTASFYRTVTNVNP